MTGATVTANDRPPNFRAGGKLYLLRCFVCAPEHGRENYALSVASGRCAWCGWSDAEKGKQQ